MKRTLLSGIVGISLLTLAGCGNVMNNTVNTTNTTATNNTLTNNTGANNTAINTTGSNTTTLSTTNSVTALVKQSMKLAEEGKAINIPFAIKQNIGSVMNVWGKPDSQNSAGAGTYATYGSHATAFGFNRGDQIFDVRSYSSELKAITASDVESVLGKPGDTRQTSDSIVYMYPAGADYQLLFVFPKASSGTVGKGVDHVSVFCPRETVNSMAATQSPPSVMIDKAPGSSGSQFTFTIENPPTGYQLVELEWIPIQGTPVVNTYQQAIDNGSSGGTNSGFSINAERKTYSFIYSSSMRDQTGTVRVIYQETSGTAMIGNSSSVTLK